MTTEPELRHPLVGHLERLATDITVDRHGDPYFAVVVLLYPDRHPSVVMVSPDRSPYSLSALRWSKKEEADAGSESRPFPMEELEEAEHGLRDASMAMRMSKYVRVPDRAVKTFARFLSEEMGKSWQRRRMAPIERAMEQAEHERKKPAVCPHCKRRFTTKGLPFHLAKSYMCSRAEAAAKATTDSQVDTEVGETK